MPRARSINIGESRFTSGTLGKWLCIFSVDAPGAASRPETEEVEIITLTFQRISILNRVGSRFNNYQIQ